MRMRHLRAAAAALVLFVAAASVGTWYAERREACCIHTLAPQMFPLKSRGAALQRAAFREPALLPVYGSSELNLPNPYHASAVFREYPTGFSVFPVGDPGSTSLLWMQALAAVGEDLRGKRVVISIPVRAFTGGLDPHAYAANFSLLHASELAFSTELSFALKQAAARRMRQYPDTLAGHPLLAFALARLSEESLSARLLYYASLPLGKLQTMALRLGDHWASVAFLRSQLGMGQVERRPARLDWNDLLARADSEARHNSEGSRFGFEKTFWSEHAPDIARQKGMYARVPSGDDGEEWADFELLLRVIRDLGGTALVLSRPLNGAYADHLGIPVSKRQSYHARLRQVAARHGAAVADFAEHEADEHFTIDPLCHLSGKGWVYSNHALDAFFHKRVPLDLW